MYTGTSKIVVNGSTLITSSVESSRSNLSRIHDAYMIMFFTQKMHFTCTVWVESLNIRDVGREKTKSCQKHESLSNHNVEFFKTNIGRYLLDVSFVTSLKSNLCIQNMKRSCTILHAEPG